MAYEALFREIQIGTMRLKNRLIIPAMSTRFVGEDGKATEQFAAYHERRAKGGWSLIITENFLIDEGVGVKRELPGLWNDEQIPGYRQVTERIHKAGGKICAQLYHAGRNTHSGITGRHNVAPSPICDPSNREVPHELTEEEILQIEEQFAQAALRARKAGFDAVELHGAHGYLIAQFLSPYSNRRGDRYGGSLENRARFAVEIVKKVKETAGPDYPVLFRISASEFISQGMNIEHSKAICRLLEAAGANAINCSQSGPATGYYTVPSFYVPNGAFLHFAEEIHKCVSVPVIAVGRINSPGLAEEVLLSGKADLVAMGRASVADPDLPVKAKRGETESILTCIACCQGCLGSTIKKKTLTCLVNPFAGKETVCSERKTAEITKRVVVIGGGVSGSEAAILAAMRGHSVVLIEKGSQLGGQWRSACVPECKAEFASFLSWQNYMLKQLNVTVCLNTEATAEMAAAFKPDVVLLASGSKTSVPPIPGLAEAEPVTVEDILQGRVPFGKHPMILGGGLSGAETAEFISGYGVPAELVEMRNQIAADCEPGPRHFLMEALEKNHVRIHTSVQVSKVEGQTVCLQKDGKEEKLTGIDQIILAAGRKPENQLKDQLEKQGLHVVCIGDAASVKNGFSNIQEAFQTVQEIL